MKVHELKTDPDVFEMSYARVKNFEVRFNDRDYQVGDILNLRETRYSSEEMKMGNPLEYTGREMQLTVKYILHGPIYGLMEGWVIMAV